MANEISVTDLIFSTSKSGVRESYIIHTRLKKNIVFGFSAYVYILIFFSFWVCILCVFNLHSCLTWPLVCCEVKLLYFHPMNIGVNITSSFSTQWHRIGDVASCMLGHFFFFTFKPLKARYWFMGWISLGLGTIMWVHILQLLLVWTQELWVCKQALLKYQ